MSEGRDDESFGAYEARVKRHGWTWFRKDKAAADVLRDAADVRSRVFRLAAGFQTVGTEAIYSVGDRWLGRDDLHGDVTEEALGEGGFDGTIPADALPQAVLLLGLPGSGKSSLLRPIAHELIRRTAEASPVIVDADVVRTLIPEYAGGLGSVVVHPETSFITNRLLLDVVLRRKANIVLDKVGDPAWTVTQAEYLIRAGWSVWCMCAEIDVEIAVDRAKRRAVVDGRYVPLEVIRDTGRRPIEAYEAVRDSGLALSGCALLSTDVRLGERPIVVDAVSEELFGPKGSPVVVWPDDEAAR